jgi:hypothetical protein
VSTNWTYVFLIVRTTTANHSISVFQPHAFPATANKLASSQSPKPSDAEMDFFKGRAPHTALPPEDSLATRLVKVLPGTFDDPIRCELEPTSLGTKPHYVALSCAWGDPTDTELISLDGCAIQKKRHPSGIRGRNARRSAPGLVEHGESTGDVRVGVCGEQAGRRNAGTTCLSVTYIPTLGRSILSHIPMYVHRP